MTTNGFGTNSYGSDNVGFEPGIVNGRAPNYSKGEYQAQLAQKMYGEKEFLEWVESPWFAFWGNVVVFALFGAPLLVIAISILVGTIFETGDLTWLAVVLAVLVVAAMVVSKFRKGYEGTKNYAAWKKTPEGAYWAAKTLHPKPWDPQNPGTYEEYTAPPAAWPSTPLSERPNNW